MMLRSTGSWSSLGTGNSKKILVIAFGEQVLTTRHCEKVYKISSKKKWNAKEQARGERINGEFANSSVLISIIHKEHECNDEEAWKVRKRGMMMMKENKPKKGDEAKKTKEKSWVIMDTPPTTVCLPASMSGSSTIVLLTPPRQDKLVSVLFTPLTPLPPFHHPCHEILE